MKDTAEDRLWYFVSDLEAFGEGRWVVDMPDVGGIYPTAQKNGTRGPLVLVIWTPGLDAVAPVGDISEVAFWWSAPIPRMPHVPDDMLCDSEGDG